MSKPIVRTPTVEFGRGPSPDVSGDVVRRKGVIFRAGDYPTQRYSMTPDDLKALVEDFESVPVDMGHPSAPSPLDGTLGDLEAVELSGDGTTLYGTVAFPRWLEERLGDAKRRVSASFDRATKRLRSLSLVTHPQISDAELQAAFACACGGHTTTTKGDGTMPEDYVLTDEERRAVDRLRAMPSDERTGVLAVLDGDYTPPDDDEDDDEPEGEEPVADGTPLAAEFAARDRRIAELEASVRAKDVAQFSAKSEAIVGALKANFKVPPSVEAALIGFRTDLAVVDLDGLAEFAAGASGGNFVARLDAILQALPAMRHGDLIGGRGGVLSSDAAEFGGETPEQRRARVDRRLANTPLGQEILARRRAGARN
jgi:hypothetical protein